MIPGLEGAEFARLGGLHRNTYLNSPKLLDPDLRLKAMTRLRFAGQITGCEGYVESAAIGLVAGRFTAASIWGCALRRLPDDGDRRAPRPYHRRPYPERGSRETRTCRLVCRWWDRRGDGKPRSFQPMNVNFGLFPPVTGPARAEGRRTSARPAKALARRRAMSERALRDLGEWEMANGGWRVANIN